MKDIRLTREQYKELLENKKVGNYKLKYNFEYGAKEPVGNFIRIEDEVGSTYINTIEIDSQGDVSLFLEESSKTKEVKFTKEELKLLHQEENVRNFWMHRIDVSTGTYDSSKGAMVNYEIIVVSKLGVQYKAIGGYYTDSTGHVFEDLTFTKKKLELTVFYVINNPTKKLFELSDDLFLYHQEEDYVEYDIGYDLNNAFENYLLNTYEVRRGQTILIHCVAPKD